jgi:multidrug efflux system outer membrane protein
VKAHLILGAALFLSGCAGTTPPIPPAAAVTPPAAWRVQLGPVAPVERQWWAAFGDPVLTGLVETALANNDDLAIAAARVREARAQEQLARSERFPTLGVGVQGGPSRSVSGVGTPITQTALQPLFQASYEVDLFGRIGSQVRAAEQGTVAAQAARDAAVLSVASATATGYITLRGLDARADILRATIAARAEALRNARDQARVGYTSELELRQSEAEYEAAAQLLPQIQLAIARQENALSQLTGTSPQAVERGLTLATLRPPPLPDGLPSTLLRRRPDLAQAEASLAASDATLAAARAQFLPSIRLTGSTGLALSTALGDPIGLWSLGASVLAPVFQGGRLQAGVNTAAARRDVAAFAYRRTALTAFREVNDSLAAVQRLAEQRIALEAQRAAVAESLRHATNRYRAGYTSYFEQLDAQRSLLAVDLSLAQLRTDQLTTTVALYQAMGGGWTGAGSFDDSPANRSLGPTPTPFGPRAANTAPNITPSAVDETPPKSALRSTERK